MDDNMDRFMAQGLKNHPSFAHKIDLNENSGDRILESVR